MTGKCFALAGWAGSLFAMNVHVAFRVTRLGCIVRRPVMAGVLVWASLLAGGLIANDRMWTSAMGSQIEATYVAKVGQDYWLREKGGRIIKLTREQLSPADAKFLEAVPVASDDWIASGHVLSITTRDPALLDTLEALVATNIPDFSVDKLELDEALSRLSAAIEQNDPKHRRIEFHLDAAVTNRRPVGVKTRNMSGIRVVELMVDGQGPTGQVSGSLSAGRIELAAYQRPLPGSGAQR